MPLVQRYMRKRMSNDIHGIPLFPEVGKMLKGLVANGITTAIVTSNSATNVQSILGTENANLIKYYACDASFFGKSAKIRKVLRWSGIAPAETICIGDEVRDLQAAHAEGIAFGAVSWGYASPKSFTPYSPKAVFLTMRDIVEKLAR